MIISASRRTDIPALVYEPAGGRRSTCPESVQQKKGQQDWTVPRDGGLFCVLDEEP